MKNNYITQPLKTLFGIRNKYPETLTLFVTSRCNLKCAHCFYWNSLNKAPELPLDFIEEKISKKLGDLRNITIGGGEPFLRRDLPQVVELFYKHNNIEKCQIPTNGTMAVIVEKMVNEMLVKCPKLKLYIALSVDGTKEHHDSIRGEGSFDKLLITYDILAKMKKTNPNLKIVVGTVVLNKNHMIIHDLIEYIKKRMPDLDAHNFEWVRGSPKDSSILLPTLDEMKEITEILKETTDYYYTKKKNIRSILERGIRNHVFDLYYETIKQKTQIVPCLAPQLYMVILETGAVFFCELLKPIGNLYNNTLDEIWNGKEAERQRISVANKECFCTQSCNQPMSVAYNIKKYPSLLKEIVKAKKNKKDIRITDEMITPIIDN